MITYQKFPFFFISGIMTLFRLFKIESTYCMSPVRCVCQYNTQCVIEVFAKNIWVVSSIFSQFLGVKNGQKSQFV